jgi:putative hydrolase of the HAD superfamily
MATDLIFDFFGTLVHYAAGPFHTAPYSRTHDHLLQSGFAIPYERFTDAFETVGNELEEQACLTGREYHMHELGRRFFQAAFATDASETIIVPFVSVFLEEWSRGIVYLDTIRSFVSGLATNYRLSVLSNTHYPPLIHTHLAGMGITDYFAEVFTSMEIGVRKPFPSIFQHALEQLRIRADDAIYIGDSYAADYQGATAAGIRCILIDPQEQHPDVPSRIASLFELEKHL